MGQTVVEKIAGRYRIDGPQPVSAGDYLTLRPHRVMSHDNSAAIIRKFHRVGATRMADPRQPVIALDHDIQNPSAETAERYRLIEEFAGTHGVEFHAAGSGIGHQLMVERLHARPGTFVVAADSHANMYGALSALGTPVGRSDAAAIWATGRVWWQVPRSVRVTLAGALPPGATAKDAILALCGLYSNGEVQGAAVEFAGPAIAGLDMDARLTLANMTTEWGAACGWFPCDDVTRDYIRQRQQALGDSIDRSGDDPAAGVGVAVEPDPDARYAGELTLDLSSVSPHVTGPHDLQHATPLTEIEPQRIAIQKAYLVSCVNSRASDLALAAEVVRGRRVAAGVELYIAAASREAQAEAGAAWQVLLDAGARPLPSGCGPCIGLGAGVLRAGEVGISASNRNFKGRMGSPDAKCYLANPAVVAASAVAGFIRGPGSATSRALVSSFRPEIGSDNVAPPVELIPGFPERVRGPLVFLPRDHLDTDGIYSKDHLYHHLTPEAMARVVFENYDPALTAGLSEGDILVAGFGFGSGSSREQAVTAISARGVKLVVAAGFSTTYLRNAFNNGFLCVICPDFVARLRSLFSGPIDRGEKTIRPGGEVDVDFSSRILGYGGQVFPLRPPGEVLQGLIVAGGIENQIRSQLSQDAL